MSSAVDMLVQERDTIVEDYNKFVQNRFVPVEIETIKREDFGIEKWIEIKELRIDKECQRDLMDNQVKKIMRTFRPSSIGRITVAEREDGYFYVLDGMHRMEACRRLGVEELPCIVVDSEDRKHNAETFLDINNNSVAVSALDKYRIGCSAGVESWLRVKYVLDKTGLVAGSGYNRLNAIGTVNAYINSATLETSIKAKMRTMEITLRLLNETTGLEGITALSINAMCIFVKEYLETDLITEEQFINRMSAVNMNSLIQEAQALKNGSTKTKIISYLAYLIFCTYNKKLKNKLPLRIQV